MRKSNRLTVHRGPAVTMTFEGAPVEAYAGETLAAALLAAGVDGFRTTREGSVRAPLCNMGTCFECALTVDGRELTRACLTPVADGMRVNRAMEV